MTTPDPLAELRALARHTPEDVEDAAGECYCGPWIDANDLNRVLSRLGEARVETRRQAPGCAMADYLVIPIQENDRAD